MGSAKGSESEVVQTQSFLAHHMQDWRSGGWVVTIPLLIAPPNFRRGVFPRIERFVG
jgi:hypothetical protein